MFLLYIKIHYRQHQSEPVYEHPLALLYDARHQLLLLFVGFLHFQWQLWNKIAVYIYKYYTVQKTPKKGVGWHFLYASKSNNVYYFVRASPQLHVSKKAIWYWRHPEIPLKTGSSSRTSACMYNSTDKLTFTIFRFNLFVLASLTDNGLQ